MTVDSKCTCVDAGNNFNVHLSLGSILCVDYNCLYLLTCVHPAEYYIHGIAINAWQIHGSYTKTGVFDILYEPPT